MGDENWQSSYFLEDKDKPLNHKNASLNESLHTQYIDLDEQDDSAYANITRHISKSVGSVCTPRQVLGLLRVLKALTLCFLALVIVSNLTYILMVSLLASDEVKQLAGGSRDTVLRLYALGLSLLGLAVELDYSKVMKKFPGLKGFLPRALLYFLIAQLTATQRAQQFLRFHNQQLTTQTTDDAAAGDDAAEAAGDDANAAADEGYGYDASTAVAVELDLPKSAIAFQRFTSFVLSLCALVYLVCGFLCFDRFTARAFLSSKDSHATASSVGPSSVQGNTNGNNNHATNADGEASVEESTNASSVP